MPAPRLRSMVCTEASLFSPELLAWADELRPAWDLSNSGVPAYMHRKLWEWLFIVQALAERGMLEPGRRGLGFGVGTDPLAAFFASKGCEIVATDLDLAEAQAAGWAASGQHASGLSALDPHGLCDPEVLAKNVTFRSMDMNRIPADLGGFDFTWSACAFEHLGSLVHGQEFVLEQMRCLRPGGVAVHTTEYNVSSERDTVKSGTTVLYRRRDVEWIARRLRRAGHRIEVDYDTGNTVADLHVDVEPYTETHLKIRVESFVSTSIGLIVERNPASRPEPARDLVRRARLDAWRVALRAGPRLAELGDQATGLSQRLRRKLRAVLGSAPRR